MGGRGEGEEKREGKIERKGGVREIRLKVLLHFTFGCCKIGFMKVFQPVLASTNDGSISSRMTSDPEKVCYLLSLNFGLSWILSHNVLSSQIESVLICFIFLYTLYIMPFVLHLSHSDAAPSPPQGSPSHHVHHSPFLPPINPSPTHHSPQHATVYHDANDDRPLPTLVKRLAKSLAHEPSLN